MVPHVLTKRSTSITPASSVFKSEAGDSVKNASTSLTSYADSEEESDGEGDFFSLKMDHEAINNANTTKQVIPVVADSFLDTNESVSASKEDTLKLNDDEPLKSNYDEPLAFNSEFSPSPWASGPSQDGHEVYGHWQNMEPAKQTASGSNDNISVQQEDLQLNDEAVSCITIEMFNLKY